MRFAEQLEEGFFGREILVEGALETVMNRRLGEGGWSAVLSDDGRKIAEYRLDAAPAWDGMAIANGKLFISLKNGELVCYGSK